MDGVVAWAVRMYQIMAWAIDTKAMSGIAGGQMFWAVFEVTLTAESA